ncbi:ABC transporter ATP-binding protein [Chromohalobacter japonicus]|uniref:ABC transporter ATP-binding protein n=2 Tax=Chromohalobacter TaxID=42054 RepID=A0A1Q8T9B8_9GAMM|nr:MULTISPECIES: ABC transporter ATP-binding protein [Chromohalobacter]CDQ36372.1 sn-glycerol-3-phosphate import ATP-binding protein UgpC [Virgibacillus halodenitrificans]MCK2043867.1 ABC transporter ATP-binding protein [Chromohalobacter moromii]MCK2046448.1 ABC transporter ATP-binding protein [Chromohalobacter moromii]MCT8505954.1 ABC transporter ATP-binding protein [Chromohalobacter moromii]MCT8516008.1 ABC transporter ATP-binding protein [Chromohalobacter sp. TMW 2.2271]
MSLNLENIDRVVGGETHIADMNLTLEPGSFNVLLGRTLSGKTTLMRLMAGLDTPTRGRVLMNGQDVTGRSVRHRNVSMVYQQFINYPSLTVYDNIASPLKLAKVGRAEIDRRVRGIAEMLHIEHLLDRQPLELSGGQQQRTAMGRALVKDADVVLFDEPLVNLDYKLREEFREELRAVFSERNCIAVYATTEPAEALALGGNTAILHQGRLLQYGPTADVYHRPIDIRAAEMFSEPPINIVKGTLSGSEISFDNTLHFPVGNDLSTLEPGEYRFGIRASHISLTPRAKSDIEIHMIVDLAEISGSETFLHVHNEHFYMTVHLEGVHEFRVDSPVKLYFPAHKVYAFDHEGAVVHIPTHLRGI